MAGNRRSGLAEFHVEGLDEFRAELKKIDMDKEMGKAHKRISGFVVDESEKTRSTLAGRFGSYKRLQGKIRPSAAKRYAQVNLRMHGAAAEWGAKVHPVYGRFIPQSTFKRPVWPKWGREGHLVRPTIQENAEEIMDRYDEEIQSLARRAFPD